MRHPFASALAVSSLALTLGGCPSGPVVNDTGTADAGAMCVPPTDAGARDSGPEMPVTCARQSGATPIPDPDNQMGGCCYRQSQTANLSAPEFRLRYIDITQPAASPLSTALVDSLLNTSLAAETFNWLVRATGADADGPVEITTGFGIRNSTNGTYAFGTTEYPPARLMGTLTGDTIAASPSLGSTLQIPIFDPTGENLQLVLELRDLRISNAPLSEMRSCIGRGAGGPRFTTPGQLDGYLTVETARAGTINVPPINSTLCSVVAGSLTAPLCDMPQSTWTAKPDSLCTATSCTPNPPCTTTVCDPDTTCNAWHLVANFAAHGINITP